MPVRMPVRVPDRPGESGTQGGGSPGAGYEPHLIHEPGGDLVRGLQSTVFTSYEELYKALAEESWFAPSVSPQRPVQFELGSFTVPKNKVLLVCDYRFKIYRQSGIDAGDVLPVEEGRFSGVMGFDITVSGRRMSHLLYQIDPVPVQVQRQSFDTPPGQRANQAQFNRAAFTSFAANTASGLSLLPVRAERQGVPNMPWTVYARAGSRVAASVVIFRRIPTPISSIEGSIKGYTVDDQTITAVMNRMRPR